MLGLRRAAVVAAIFAGMLSASFNTTSDAALPAGTNFQGLWWAAPAASESGWGINFADQGGVIFATWYTYNASNKSLWLTMIANKTGEGQYAGTLYQTHGPAFNAVPFNPAAVTVTPAGSGTLSFTDASNGIFAYTVNGVSQAKAITRQVFGPQATCVFGAQSDLTRPTNYQDLWWAAPGGAESGWGVNFTHQGDTIFATWFTYDVDGSQMWLAATTPKTGPGTYSGTIYRTTGPEFDSVPFSPANVVALAVGTLTLTFADGNNATFAYTVGSVTQSKSITRQVFTAPGTVCQYAEGMWTGTTSLDETAEVIVLDGGTHYVVYSLPNSALDGGIMQGTSVMDSGAFSSPNSVNYPIAQANETGQVPNPAALSGGYTPRSALQLTITDSGSRTLAASFIPGSDQPATLAAVAGNYTGFTGHAGGRIAAPIFVDATGHVTVANGACGQSGTLTPRSSINAFDFKIQAVNGLCIYGKGPITGIAYYDAATHTLRAMAPFGTDLFYVIGTKP